MSEPTYFKQSCPTCGRSLQVRVKYLGRRVLCRHCHGEFEAGDALLNQTEPLSGTKLIERADRLLEESTMRVAHRP